MALYKGSVKVSGRGSGFSPENSGCEGQVLTKTCSGYAFCDVPEELPSGGTAGQVLTKTNNGVDYCDIPSQLPSGGTEGQVLTKTATGQDWCKASGQKIKKVDILLVGGGGGGGGALDTTMRGGGGGAGEVRFVFGQVLNCDSNCIKIGAGGAGGAGACDVGNQGCPTYFNSIMATGGGGGGAYCSSYCTSKLNGASGGGVSNSFVGFGFFGHNGGFGSSLCSGGGGGAGGDGGGFNYYCEHPLYAVPFGGPGITTCFGGSVRKIGGGGGGGGTLSCCSRYGSGWDDTFGHKFGGGLGGCLDGLCKGCPGTANTGGGGGGGSTNAHNSGAGGGAGGSGLVIVRYPANGSYGITSATGGTVTTCTIDGTSYNIHTFTSNGTFCITG